MVCKNLAVELKFVGQSAYVFPEGKLASGLGRAAKSEP